MSNLSKIKAYKTTTAEVLKNAKANIFGRPNYFEKDQKLADEQIKSELQRSSGTADIACIPFSDLPGSEIEAMTIGNTLKQNNVSVSLSIKNEALESTFKNMANSEVIHVATHGYFIPTKTENEKESMLRSGLVFANVNPKAKEDGLLTAYELSGLDLNKTKLLVLSACETGLGEIKNGEGVFGLQRAAAMAGCKSVVLSLWTVNDNSTKDLMIEFYSHWVETQNTSSALRNAQLKTLKKYKSPYYWAPFIITGN